MSVDDYMRRLRSAAREALEETGQILERRFAEEITSPKWGWPNPPSPRDIVDTGELRGSYERETQSAPTYVRQIHTWLAPHALLVHEGYTHRNGKSYPGRPWTKRPMAEAKDILLRLWKARL